jgi:hypothetical protein
VTETGGEGGDSLPTEARYGDYQVITELEERCKRYESKIRSLEMIIQTMGEERANIMAALKAILVVTKELTM